MELMPIKYVEVSFDRNAEPKPLHANFFVSATSRTDDPITEHTEFVRGALMRAINEDPLSRRVKPTFEGRLEPTFMQMAYIDDLFERGFNSVRRFRNFDRAFGDTVVHGTPKFMSTADVISFASVLKNIVRGIYEFSQRPNVFLFPKQISHVVLEEPADYAGSGANFVFGALSCIVKDAVNAAIYSRVFYRDGTYVEENWDGRVLRIHRPSGLYVDIVLTAHSWLNEFHSISIFYPKQVHELLNNLMDWDREVATRYV